MINYFKNHLITWFLNFILRLLTYFILAVFGGQVRGVQNSLKNQILWPVVWLLRTRSWNKLYRVRCKILAKSVPFFMALGYSNDLLQRLPTSRNQDISFSFFSLDKGTSARKRRPRWSKNHFFYDVGQKSHTLLLINITCTSPSPTPRYLCI